MVSRHKPPDRQAPLVGLAAALLAGVALGLGFVPGLLARVPGCPSRWVLGVPCPACGSSRALAFLGRGALIEAVALAPLPTLAILGVLGLAALRAVAAIRGRPGPERAIEGLLRRPAVRIAIAAFAIALYGLTLWRGSTR